MMEQDEELDIIETICAVREINLNIHEQINMDDESSIPFLEYYTDGFSSIIKFMDNIIWSSNDDNRAYADDSDDELELMEGYLKRIVTDMLTSCRNLNVNKDAENDKDSEE